jgi:hypothetical protein
VSLPASRCYRVTQHEQDEDRSRDWDFQLATVSCTDKRDTSAVVAQRVEPVPCQKVGDVCSLRPPRKSATAATSGNYHDQYVRLLAANDNERAGQMLGELKLTIINLGVQVRILQLADNGAEAVVVRDMWDVDPVRRPGNRLDGRKLWIDNTQWVLSQL